jgi:hypothetical protein
MTRLLIALFEGEELSGLASLARLIGLARVRDAAVRVAYFHRIPADRLDHQDRVVVDRYREMLRVEEAMRESVAATLRAAGRAPVECVVRFGVPVVEVAREAEAFAADTVAFTAGLDLAGRWRAWRIRRRLAGVFDARVLVVEGGTEALVPAGAAERAAAL